MAFKAPPHLQDLGKSAEQELFELIERRLRLRGSKLIVQRGSDDPKENGEFGDCLVRIAEDEMELVTLELKGSTYPLTFTMSDYEYRCSIAAWVIVKGTHGIWCVPMATAKEFASSNVASDGKKYWVSNPPFVSHVRLDNVLDGIQLRCGEKP